MIVCLGISQSDLLAAYNTKILKPKEKRKDTKKTLLLER